MNIVGSFLFVALLSVCVFASAMPVNVFVDMIFSTLLLLFGDANFWALNMNLRPDYLECAFANGKSS